MVKNMIYTTNYKSELGDILLASDGEKLIGLWFEEQKYYFPFKIEENNIGINDDLSIFRQTRNWLDKYFCGQKVSPYELNLKLIGSDFRQIVWKILCNIPYGETMTYGQIAKRVSGIMGVESMSAQAVGNAVGHNPISIIIPCHRVLGSDGSLTGYAGGVDRKKRLLEIERGLI